jgi:NADH-quinone oxidoreductase subunit F
MNRLESIQAFRSFQRHLVDGLAPARPTIVINAGTCGQASGANDLIRVAKKEFLERELADSVNLRITGCHGFCQMEPSVLVEPRGTFYPKVNTKGMVRIVGAVAIGEVVDDLLFVDPETGKRIEKQDDIPFFRTQTRTLLSRQEKVDPIRIYNYIEHGGYAALAKVLDKADRQWVLGEVKAAGLRGRGGAGFPTGMKWEMLAKADKPKKFIVCNADEGDPGAYMNRTVLEGNPHSIIEGMVVGAYATGATEGVMYVRAEYPLAIKHLIIALRQAREMGLLGQNILGTGFSFDISLVKGAGAFVCGEETALIRSIEGKMGEPRQRPPYPVQRGIDGFPTIINNVETWANVPQIINNGAAAFAKTGTPTCTGAKIFSLVGKVKYTGLVEVPMGITIGKVVNDIGGGAAGNGRIKAVQTGGPSGGCIPANMFDLAIDYESLNKAGSIMGSGGMIVLDENTCMVDFAKYFLNFLKDESCGKCFTCRKGTQRMWEILDDITKGKGSLEQLALLEEVAQTVKDTTMCGLGQTAANPVLSTLRYFRHEYMEHIIQKKCSAYVCKDLVGAPCGTACPLGTEAWKYVANIAKGDYDEAYKAIRENNPLPSVCSRVCDHKCEHHCKLGTTGSQPIAIRALKRFVTDRVKPSVFKPKRAKKAAGAKIAVVGAGPAGLSAAHGLSLMGYKVTVFEADSKPGGMLVSCIPAYRLPREVLKKEIDALVDDNVTLKLNTKLGKDVTISGLLKDGFKAVFVATGSNKSRKLELAGEDTDGVIPSMKFLRAYNLDGKGLAKGRVGVVGGGNSAIDAARVALRQKGVESVTIFYRRTRQEMPAFVEEIEAALQEGVKLEILEAPTKIKVKGGKLAAVEFVKNQLGERDAGGRRKPVPVKGSEHAVELDTLIVAISEQPDSDKFTAAGLAKNADGTVRSRDLADGLRRRLRGRRPGDGPEHGGGRDRGRQEGGRGDRPLRARRGAEAGASAEDPEDVHRGRRGSRVRDDGQPEAGGPGRGRGLPLQGFLRGGVGDLGEGRRARGAALPEVRS